MSDRLAVGRIELFLFLSRRRRRQILFEFCTRAFDLEASFELLSYLFYLLDCLLIFTLKSFGDVTSVLYLFQLAIDDLELLLVLEVGWNVRLGVL